MEFLRKMEFFRKQNTLPRNTIAITDNMQNKPSCLPWCFKYKTVVHGPYISNTPCACSAKYAIQLSTHRPLRRQGEGAVWPTVNVDRISNMIHLHVPLANKEIKDLQTQTNLQLSDTNTKLADMHLDMKDLEFGIRTQLDDIKVKQSGAHMSLAKMLKMTKLFS